MFPFPLLELLGGEKPVPEGSGMCGGAGLASVDLEIYELLNRFGFLVGFIIVVENPNLRIGVRGAGVMEGEEIGESVAGAGAGVGAAERGRRRVVVGDAGEAFLKAESTETGDGDGGVAVAGGEAVGFGSHE